MSASLTCQSRAIQFNLKCWNLSGVNNLSIFHKKVSRVPFLCQALNSECFSVLELNPERAYRQFLTLLTHFGPAVSVVWSLSGGELLLEGDLKEGKKEVVQKELDQKSVKMDSNPVFVLNCMILDISYHLTYPGLSFLIY